MSPKNLHKWLIIRLMLVSLMLSLVIGGLVNYFGNARMDNHFVDAAKIEAASYSSQFATYLESPSTQALALFKLEINDIIKHDNLILVKFYDASSHKVAEVAEPSAKEVEEKLSKLVPKFSRDGSVICNKLPLGNETYLRVYVSIHNHTGAKIGYMEGIYHVPIATITRIKREIILSLFMVVMSIFVTSLALYPLIIQLNRRQQRYSRSLAMTNIGMLKVLGSAIAKRDSDTNLHNYRVTLYSVRIGEKLGLSPAAMQGLIKGAFLHDVGKIAISDSILLKQGKLTGEEFKAMQAHVGHGEDIICSYTWLEDAVEVVRHHHEKFDGSGYLGGKIGREIPLNARIFAVADVFDALTSRRPYKEPLSFQESVEIIRDSRGNHFDPAVVEQFLAHAEEFYAEICCKDEVELHGKLEGCIGRHFHYR